MHLLNETLVNPHLEHIPGLTTLTVGSLSGGDLEGLGGESDRSLDVEGLCASTVDELLADLLQGSNLARGQGDTDLVDFLQRIEYVSSGLGTSRFRGLLYSKG